MIRGISKYLSQSVTDQILDENVYKYAIKHHQRARLPLWLSVRLYAHNHWNKFFSNCCPIKNRLTIFYKESEKRLEKSFDIIKILKDIKYLKVLTKVMIPLEYDTKFQIYHNQKNIIDLDKVSGETFGHQSSGFDEKLYESDDQEEDDKKQGENLNMMESTLEHKRTSKVKDPPKNIIDHFLMHTRKEKIQLQKQITQRKMGSDGCTQGEFSDFLIKKMRESKAQRT